MGVYYQQGRKEPFTGQANSTTVNTPTQIYKANGTIITGGTNLGGYTYQGSSIAQIYAAINTPTTHYYNPSDGGWFSSNPDSWTRANYPTPSTSKSIFDPCPYGYRVPTANADSKGDSDFFGFTTPPSWSINIVNGVSFLDFWWPTSGFRGINSSTLGSIGNEGTYWSASPYSSSDSYFAYRLLFGSNQILPVNHHYRSWGFSIRCVQE